MDTWLAYTLVKNNPEDAAKVDMDRAGRSDIPDIDKKKLEYTTFLVIVDAEDQIEVSFSRNYIPEAKDSKAVLMDIDLRYTLLRGESGCYSYGILDRQKWLGYTIPNAMLPYTLFRMKFRNVVIADNRRRKMPLPEDQMKGCGQALEYPN